jgi:hypothetical protein
MKSRTFRLVVAVVAVAGLTSTSIALGALRHHHDGGGAGNGGGEQFVARLTGYQEVPSLNSAGQGLLKLSVSGGQITYDLTFSGLSGPASMAHVHVGQPGVSGGVSFFLCGGNKPACPNSTSGEVTGTVTSSDIQAIPTQGFDAGDINSVIKAMEAGVTYGNMHTAKFPNGEIRGQLNGGFGHGRFGND